MTNTNKIQDIFDAIDAADSFIDGITFEDFQTDQKTIYAVTRAVVIISELVKSIPISSREQYPQVPGKSIMEMEDKLTYHYFDVNLQVLWHTVQEKLVILKPIIQEILALTKFNTVRNP